MPGSRDIDFKVHHSVKKWIKQSCLPTCGTSVNKIFLYWLDSLRDKATMAASYFSPVSLDDSVTAVKEPSRKAYAQGRDPDLLREQLSALLQNESSWAVASIPCQKAFMVGIEAKAKPLGDWRRKICQWSYRVIDHFRMDREVVSVGMNLFDRYLAAGSPASSSQNKTRFSCLCPTCKRYIDGRTYQLAAMTCLYLGIKLHSETVTDNTYSKRRRFRLTSFVDLSRGLFCTRDIADMEHEVLKTLSWKVCTPTPMTFVSYILTLTPVTSDVLESHDSSALVLHVVQELSRYLTELAVCLGSELPQYPPSQVALASILVSMDLLTLEAISIHVRDCFATAAFALCECDGVWESIQYLRLKLQQSLWPEMLFDACTDLGHPISIARNNGLLDIDQVYRVQKHAAAAPNILAVSPLQSRTLKDLSAYEGSPVSVAL